MKRQTLSRQSKRVFCKVSNVFLILVISSSLIIPSPVAWFSPVSAAYALNETMAVPDLPPPGKMLRLSGTFNPMIIQGVRIYPDQPLRLDFIVDPGDEDPDGKEFRRQATDLIKYFLAALTIPEEDMWVNLSPYEKDRIIPKAFGKTEMGRDLLALDYLLKQISASLIYPEEKLGQEFWQRAYEKAYRRFGTINIPVNTFNKIWIVPDKAVVYEKAGGAYVVDSHLKVMLEQDYLALQKTRGTKKFGLDHVSDHEAKEISGDVSDIVREILIPELEKEVNESKTFSNLRQIYNSVILASWYKDNLRQSLLGKVYVNKTRTKGIDVEDKRISEKIYQQYLMAFEKGVFNYIREENHPEETQPIPRKYFSGGMQLTAVKHIREDLRGNLPARYQERGAGTASGSSPINIQVNLTEVGNKAAADAMDDVVRLSIDGQGAVSSPLQLPETSVRTSLSRIDQRKLLSALQILDFMAEAVDVLNGKKAAPVRMGETTEADLQGVDENSWAAQNVPDLMDRTVISLQMEASLDRGFLVDTLAAKYGEELTRFISQVNMSGGLGALMHDLVVAWKRAGVDVVSFNTLNNRIKGTVREVPEEIFKNYIADGSVALGQLIRDVLPPAQKSVTLRLNDTDFRNKAVFDKAKQLVGRAVSKQELEQLGVDGGLAEALSSRLIQMGYLDQSQYVLKGLEDEAREAFSELDDEKFAKMKELLAQAQGRPITVDLYELESSFTTLPEFYEDAYYLDDDGNKQYIFDEIYSDEISPAKDWRVIQMVVYNKATQRFARMLQADGRIKSKVTWVENEIFVSLPKNEQMDLAELGIEQPPVTETAMRAEINHSVYKPAMYNPPEYAFKLMGFEEKDRQAIVFKEGGRDVIDIVRYAAENVDLFMGVSVYEHTPVLRNNLLPDLAHKIWQWYQGEQRNSNGVLFDQWQGHELRSIIDDYKVSLGLTAQTDDVQFYDKLEENPAELARFQSQFEQIKVLYMMDLYLWLQENQTQDLGGSQWLAQLLKESGLDSQTDVRALREEYAGLLNQALADVKNEGQWRALDEKLGKLKDVLIQNPVAANLRRQVPYKGPDIYKEILGILKDPRALKQFRDSKMRLALGGRIFGHEANQLFEELKGMVKDLGLGDQIAFLENYNPYDAPLIFRGVAATIMLSDEFLEASATSMMKALTNGAFMFGVWGGTMPELFDVIDVRTGQRVDVIKTGLTHNELLRGLKYGEYEIRNGYLIKYSGRKSQQEGGGRRPSAGNLLVGLARLGNRFNTESKQLLYNALRTSPKVDVEKSQSRAQLQLLQLALKMKTQRARLINDLLEHKEAVLTALDQPVEDRDPFFWQYINEKGVQNIASSEPSVADFLATYERLKLSGEQLRRVIAHHSNNGTAYNRRGDLIHHLEDLLGREGLEPLKTIYDNLVEGDIETALYQAWGTETIFEDAVHSANPEEALQEVFLELSREKGLLAEVDRLLEPVRDMSEQDIAKWNEVMKNLFAADGNVEKLRRPELSDGRDLYLPSQEIIQQAVASSPLFQSAITEEVVDNGQYGGINLNPQLLDLQIKRDGEGVPLPLPQQPVQQMDIGGFLPVIINITPVPNLPLLFGSDSDVEPGDEDQLSSLDAGAKQDVF